MVVSLSEPYFEQVIEAAFLHSKPNCYFVGPFARRVSFASQQLRALDLVMALKQKDKLPADARVAVIGAGLAGLMAVAALCGMGCHVDLYEAEANVLMRQRGAKHRLIHPTISRWPMERLSLSTALPFFDWGVATCDAILKTLEDEWVQFFGRGTLAHGKVDFKRGEKVTYLAPVNNHKSVSLRLEAGQSVDYGLVLVATGYGAETPGDSAIPVTSYWSPDDLELKRLSGGEFAIGGCGDGGLIDALRLAHGAFDKSWQAFALAAAIDAFAPKTKEIVRRAEHDALMMIKSIHAMSRPSPRKRNFDDSERDVHKFLYDAYLEAIAQLPGAITESLDKSLLMRGPRPGDIKLVAKEAKPTTPFAAPIHKLMIVHAIEKGHIEWIPGDLRVPTKRPPYVRGRILKGHEVIRRYGAPPALQGLLGTDEAASLMLRQLMLADRIETGGERPADPPPGYPKRNPKDPVFIRSRQQAAAALTQAVDPRYVIDCAANGDGFSYALISDEPDPPAGSGAAAGITLPTDVIFDIPVGHGCVGEYPLFS